MAHPDRNIGPSPRQLVTPVGRSVSSEPGGLSSQHDAGELGFPEGTIGMTGTLPGQAVEPQVSSDQSIPPSLAGQPGPEAIREPTGDLSTTRSGADIETATDRPAHVPDPRPQHATDTTQAEAVEAPPGKTTSLRFLSKEEVSAQKEEAERRKAKRYARLDEVRLVQLAQEYDPVAHGEIYERYVTGVYKYVYYRVGDTDTAEDLTEDVFFRALTGLGGFESRQGVSFSAWLYRIASNRVIDHFRRQPRQTPVSLEEKSVVSVGSPTQRLSEIFTHQALRDALTQLTEDQQRVIVLKFADGLGNREVAQLLRKTEGAVKTMQNRALAALSRVLSEVRGDSHADYMPASDWPPPADVPDSVRYSFEIAMFRLAGHIVNQEITSRDPEKATLRRSVWRDHISRIIDGQLEPIEQRVLFQLIYDEMTIAEIQKDLPRGHNVNEILKEAREKITAPLMRTVGMDFRELYDLFRGTGALFALSQPIRGGLREITRRREKIVCPRVSNSTYGRLYLTEERLHDMFGPHNKQLSQLTQEDRARWIAIMQSTIPIRVKSGQPLPIREGTRILVHRDTILVYEERLGSEMIRHRKPRRMTTQMGRELLISDGRSFGAVPARISRAAAWDSCLIRLIHRDAEFLHSAADRNTEVSAEELLERRAELLKWYKDLEPVVGTRFFGEETTPIEQQLEALLKADPDNPSPKGVERLDDLRRGVRLLTPLQLKVVELTFRDGMGDSEIGQALNGRPPGRVKNIRSRALKTVKTHLEITQ